MNAIQQRCRPKHQVLVLKCYPRTTKGAVDVKPNSSELSYLLFYATSRRSKIQKIGGFLEKKTASDVWRQRIGNVQVTLGILTALIEKTPKDLPLFATNVLKILDQILRSRDVTMVESSLPTFEALCEHHDPSSLLADQAYLRQYEAVVRSYAAIASTRQSGAAATGTNGNGGKPVEIRWRNAGLEAIRAIALSDALNTPQGRQIGVVLPMVLENLWTDNDDFLEVLRQRAMMEEKIESDSRLMRRRTSISTVRTVDTAGDTNPIALSGTAYDVDKLAEEDTGVLAMQCLKQVFVVPNRAQIHTGTATLLRFIAERVAQDENVVKTDAKTGKDSGWAIKMLDLVSRWAPVQDRYVILVTAMDTLAKTPVEERSESLRMHLVLTAMIGSLLRSDVNLIGLSVMDVLIALIQHMKKLLQLPGAATQFQVWQVPDDAAAAEAATTLANQCKELLGRLQQCIGDLATHVYYADQISDMIAAILLRLKPSRSSSTNSSPQGEKAEGSTAGANGGGSVAGNAGQSSAVDLSESQPHLDAYFSAIAGKIAALRAVKSILLVANPKTKIAGNVSLSRNRVPIQVWEGTHWLLRDPDGGVRKAYVDAVLTWLERETTKADLKARDESLAQHHKSSLKNSRELPPATIARRAASSASNRGNPSGEKPIKVPRSHFLQLLHLSIYDNALQYVDFETDIVLLHVLLTKLVLQLGVNAARFGMPMIFRLQEDILEVDAPVHKVRIGSLCHGYFWALTEAFDFDASVVGRAIQNEIVRRRSKNFWVEGVSVPPPPLELAGTPGLARPQPKMPLHEIESEALLPFDDRISLVECIASGYQEATISPPSSPAASPGRTFSNPVLSSTLSTIPTGTGPGNVAADSELPSKFREQMLTDWSRDSVMLALQAGSKSESLNGSRTGTTGTNHRSQGNRLAVNGGPFGGANGYGLIGSNSPFGGSQQNLRPGSPHGHGLAPLATGKLRKSSVRSGVSPSPSGSSRGFVASVEQLKLVLSGHMPAGNIGAGTGVEDDEDGSDSGSDSMVSYEFTPSEMSFSPGNQGIENGEPATGSLSLQKSMSARESTPLSRTTSGKDQSGLPSVARSASGKETQALSPLSRSMSAKERGGPLSSNPTHEQTAAPPLQPAKTAVPAQKPVRTASQKTEQTEEDQENVPPVPPLPNQKLTGKIGEQITVQETVGAPPASRSGGVRPGSRGGNALHGLGIATHDHGKHHARRNLSSRGGDGNHVGNVMREESGIGGMDLQELLKGIDSRAGEESLGNMTRPPY